MHMRFLDRDPEMRRLVGLGRREGGGLGLVWGRRRIGKTRLLLEWVQQNSGIYTVADQSAPAVQRRYFSEALSAVIEGFSEPEYPDWRSLLRALALGAPPFATGRGTARSGTWCRRPSKEMRSSSAKSSGPSSRLQKPHSRRPPGPCSPRALRMVTLLSCRFRGFDPFPGHDQGARHSA